MTRLERFNASLKSLDFKGFPNFYDHFYDHILKQFIFLYPSKIYFIIRYVNPKEGRF